VYFTQENLTLINKNEEQDARRNWYFIFSC